MSSFDVTTASHNDEPTLVVRGEVDLVSAEALVESASKYLSDSAGPFCALDLSGVTFIDSTGVGALIKIRNEALERGWELRLVNPSRHVLRTLNLTGLSQMFGVDGYESP